MNLNIEEKFNKVIWWVLQEIKKETLATPEDKYIYFEPQSDDNLNLPITDQRRALKLLEKEKAIIIKKDKYTLGMREFAELSNWKPIGYFLDILQPKFDKLYDKFKELNDLEYSKPMVELPTIQPVSEREIEIEKDIKRGQRQQDEIIERRRLHKEQMKQDRILRTSIDKYMHALNLIIERAEYIEDGNNFSIDFYDFNFEQMIGSKMLEKFLTEMQKERCFEKYSKTNYNWHTRFTFIKPSIEKLKEFRQKRSIGTFDEEVFKTQQLIKKIGDDINLKAQTAEYKNGVLSFKAKEIDFKNRPNQKELLATLFKEPTKNWSYDEIQEDWDTLKRLNLVKYPDNYWRKFYSAGDGINNAIAIKTQVEDFIIKNTKEIRINPNYVS